MTPEHISELINYAKKLTQEEKEFRNEAFLAVFSKLLDSERTSSIQTSKEQVTPKANNKEMSLKEFIISKRPTNDIERTACFGYFLEHFRNINSWTTADIIATFKEAKEPVPINPSDKILKCRVRAWVMASGDGYMLTNTGETFVEHLPERENES